MNTLSGYVVDNIFVWLHFIKQVVYSTFWFLPNFANPINTAFTLCFYAVATLLWTLASPLVAFLHWFQYIPGGNPILWADPDIFNHMSEDRINYAKSILSSPLSDMNFDRVSNRPIGRFNIDVAHFLLLLSTAVYLREADSYNEETALAEIRELAQKWGLKFESTAQLTMSDNVFRGPYCGIFIKQGPMPFVIVAFKGTTPFDYGEWSGDFQLVKTVAPFLDGHVHKGFYDKLFPDLDGNSFHPYGAIIRRLKDLIEELRTADNQEIPIWITGHSLGAALAAVFTSRLMKCPEDLGDLSKFRLMDCYTFGCPPIGDANFAISVESYQNMPIDRYSEIWRVIDDADVATRIPFVVEDINVLARLGTDQIHHYAHVGVPILLRWDGSKPMVYPQLYSTTIKVEMYTHVKGGEKRLPLKKSQKNLLIGLANTIKYIFPVAVTGNYDRLNPAPLKIWLGRLFLPKFFLDHFPHRYYESLEKARMLTLRKGN
jgi:pimeloyl-ACP methyl ester carboxylesterase